MNATEKVSQALTDFYGDGVKLEPYYVGVFVSRLKEQGLTIVPIEPTEEMVLAVTDAWGWDVPMAFWKDMIAAYEKEREK